MCGVNSGCLKRDNFLHLSLFYLGYYKKCIDKMAGYDMIFDKGGGLKYGSCKSSLHNHVVIVSKGRNH